MADWAPFIGISIFVRLFCAMRSAWVLFITDGPLAWKFGLRGKNKYDDIEGPFYIIGSPKRQIEEGKGVLAETTLLNKYEPFIFVLDIKDTKGDPVRNATLDCWQANSEGGYYFSSWTLRGKVTTDAQGRVEILTVRPGYYAGRAGHLHLMLEGTKGKHVPMTTQVYVCSGNDPHDLDRDMSNYYRRRPDHGVATCWGIPAAKSEEPLCGFPVLPGEESELAKRVQWWNGKMEEKGVKRKVLGIGRHEIRLTAM